MSALPALPPLTEAEYLAFDLSHEGKHELVNGELLARTGAPPEHGHVVTNLTLAVGTRLRGGPCRAVGSDQRLRIDETGLYAYPDLVVYCGTPRYAGTNPLTLLNPSVIFEVLSESTEAWDRGGKAAHYRRRASVQAYVLISWRDRRVEHYARGAEGTWLLSEAQEAGVGVEGADGVIALPSLGLSLSLTELFEGLDTLQAALRLPLSAAGSPSE